MQEIPSMTLNLSWILSLQISLFNPFLSQVNCWYNFNRPYVIDTMQLFRLTVAQLSGLTGFDISPSFTK